MSTTKLEQKERLKQLTATTDWKKVNNKRHWGCSRGKTINLAHILHTARKVPIHPSAKLKKAILTFTRLYPHFRPTLSMETVGTMYLVIGYFFMKGYITSPIYHYLIYSIYMKWEVQNKVRSKPKLKKEMLKQFEELGIIKLLFEEAVKKLGHLELEPTYDERYKKSKEEYVSLQEAVNQNTYDNMFCYSFDK